MTTEIIAFFQGREDDEEDQEEESLPWASREVLAGAGFSEKSDVYSFGIILWEMMQTDGARPYKGLTPTEVGGVRGSRHVGVGINLSQKNAHFFVERLMDHIRFHKIAVPEFRTLSST